MDIILKGGSPPSTTFGVPFTPALVDPTFGALRTIVKPSEYNFGSFNGGHFRLSSSTGAYTGAAAAAPLFSARWGITSGFLLVKRIQISVAITTAFTTAQAIDFDLIKLTGFTASDSGGTTLTPQAQTNPSSNKKRTSLMNNAQITDLRIAATGALTAGTRTLDAFPLSSGAIPGLSNGLGNAGFLDLYKFDENNEHPLMLQNNEGFLIRNVTAMGSTGVIKVYAIFDWAEVPGI